MPCEANTGNWQLRAGFWFPEEHPVALSRARRQHAGMYMPSLSNLGIQDPAERSGFRFLVSQQPSDRAFQLRYDKRKDACPAYQVKVFKTLRSKRSKYCQLSTACCPVFQLGQFPLLTQGVFTPL